MNKVKITKDLEGCKFLGWAHLEEDPRFPVLGLLFDARDWKHASGEPYLVVLLAVLQGKFKELSFLLPNDDITSKEFRWALDKALYSLKRTYETDLKSSVEIL